MIDKVLGRILCQVGLNFLLCDGVDWLGTIGGFRPPFEPPGKIVRMVTRRLLFGSEKAINSILNAQILKTWVVRLTGPSPIPAAGFPSRVNNALARSRSNLARAFVLKWRRRPCPSTNWYRSLIG